MQWHVRYLRNNGHPSLNIYNDPLFADFQMTLDAELWWRVRQAKLLSEEEEMLWVLGDHTPLNAIVFMTGLYFALHSGKEHHELHSYTNTQTQVIRRDGGLISCILATPPKIIQGG